MSSKLGNAFASFLASVGQPRGDQESPWALANTRGKHVRLCEEFISTWTNPVGPDPRVGHRYDKKQGRRAAFVLDLLGLVAGLGLR